MRYIEAKCLEAECTQFLPSYAIGSYQVKEASDSMEQLVAQQADSHAQSWGHDVVMQTVFKRT